jgi:hypothetical protein
LTVLFVAKFEPEFAGQELHGLGEGQVVDLLDEGDHIAALATTEAVPMPALRADEEGRGALIMEGAKPLLGTHPSRLQGDVVGHDLVQPRVLSDVFDVLTTDSGHEGGV